MALPPLIGHAGLRARLAQAVAKGTLPQVILLTGPAGVGKQRLALWLAQLVLCERRGKEPCGSAGPAAWQVALSIPICIGSSRSRGPKFRIRTSRSKKQPRRWPGPGGADERSRCYPESDGMASHGIAMVRLLQRRAALTSVEGGRRVFIIGEADRLVAQEASPEAANALLKLLEEPPPGSLFLLTTVDPSRLLPTIRSRAVALRLSRLTDGDVKGFLETSVRPSRRQKSWSSG